MSEMKGANLRAIFAGSIWAPWGLAGLFSGVEVGMNDYSVSWQDILKDEAVDVEREMIEWNRELYCQEPRSHGMLIIKWDIWSKLFSRGVGRLKVEAIPVDAAKSRPRQRVSHQKITTATRLFSLSTLSITSSAEAWKDAYWIVWRYQLWSRCVCSPADY